MKYKTVIAIYMRLSQDDGDFDVESNSIINQRLLLRSYVAKHFEDYELLEFQDDGYSGVNLERPGVSEMLGKVKRGEIDCIIVKDLSRFSRDYIETGSYLEQIFPFARVRFIAVNDGYDSADYRGDVAGMSTAFKNLMNDLYCKDISVKVKASLRVKKEKGIYAKLLAAPDEVVTGTVKELAEKYDVELMIMTGFLDGINDSLKEENPIEEMTEDTVVNLGFDKEKLYKNMVMAKADWLYELPQWKEIYSEEELKRLYKEQKESTTIRKGKKIGRNDPCPCGSGKKYKKCCGK